MQLQNLHRGFRFPPSPQTLGRSPKTSVFVGRQDLIEPDRGECFELLDAVVADVADRKVSKVHPNRRNSQKGRAPDVF
jgi:hypothetical protein